MQTFEMRRQLFVKMLKAYFQSSLTYNSCYVLNYLPSFMKDIALRCSECNCSSGIRYRCLYASLTTS